MKITGPDKYKLICSSTSFKVVASDKSNKFSGMATTSIPKIYLILEKGRPIYVGGTVRSIRNHLQSGFNATGKDGDISHTWKGKVKNVILHIWYLEEAREKNQEIEMEIVESEVAFLIHEYFNWPKYQTEIHLHKSTIHHRRLARIIVSEYFQDSDQKSNTKNKYEEILDTLMGKYGVNNIPLKLSHKVLVEEFNKDNNLEKLKMELKDSSKTLQIMVPQDESTQSRERLAKEIENKSNRIRIIGKSGNIFRALYYPKEIKSGEQRVPINRYFKSELLFGYAKFFDFVRKRVWDIYPELLKEGVVSVDKNNRYIALRISDGSWYTSQVIINSTRRQFIKPDIMSRLEFSLVNLRHKIYRKLPDHNVEESLTSEDMELIKVSSKLEEVYPGCAEKIRDYYNRYLLPFAPDEVIAKWQKPILKLKESLQNFAFLPSYFHPLDIPKPSELPNIKKDNTLTKGKKKNWNDIVGTDYFEFPLSAIRQSKRLHLWDLDFEFNYFHINLAIQMYTLDSNIHSINEALEYVVYFFNSSQNKNEKELYWRLLLLLIQNTVKKKHNLKRTPQKHFEIFFDFIYILTKKDKFIITDKYFEFNSKPKGYEGYKNVRNDVTRLRKMIKKMSSLENKTEERLLKIIKKGIDDISLNNDYMAYVDTYKNLIKNSSNPENYIPNFRINKDKKSNQ